MPPAAVLFLRLEGPLQSWGDDSRWTIRTTRREPTKSGVLGLIAAASGWGLDKAGDDAVADLASNVHVGVRVDRPGRVLRDFHTVLGPLLKAEGGYKGKKGDWENITSERYYLADACFLVALLGGEDRLRAVEAALRSPRWLPFLGRKSCPPSLPLVPALPGRDTITCHPHLASALATFPRLRDPACADVPPPAGRTRCVIEVTPDDDRAALRRNHPISPRRDVPASFSRRLFDLRHVYEAFVTPPEEG